MMQIEELETRLIFAAVPIPVASVTPVRVSESAVAVVTVSLNRVAAQNVSLSYSTVQVPQSAVPGEDFIPVAGVLTIPAGQRSGTIAVSIVDDAIHEKTETFRVAIHSGVGLRLKSKFATVTIVDNDPKVGFAPSSIAGRTADAVISSGNRPFASRGAFTLQIRPDGWYSLRGNEAVVDSFGIFSYVRTGLNTARISATDVQLGGTITGTLTFTSETVARFSWRLGGASQSGVFIFRGL